MGLWDSIKSAATKAKCGMGFHGGDLRNPEGMPRCHLEKTCPDCGELVSEKRHAYPLEWKDAPYDHSSQIRCNRIQECTHCGDIAKKEIHAEYRELGKNANCQIILECKKCGKEKAGNVSHMFTRVGKTDSGKIILECVHCNERETRDFY